MPDCATDGQKLEDLCSSLIPQDDPLWPHARACVAEAARLFAQANAARVAAQRCQRFRDVDRVKAELHT